MISPSYILHTPPSNRVQESAPEYVYEPICARVFAYVVCSVCIFDFRFDSSFWLLWIFNVSLVGTKIYLLRSKLDRLSCHNYTKKHIRFFLCQTNSILILVGLHLSRIQKHRKFIFVPMSRYFLSFFLSTASTTPWITLKNIRLRKNNIIIVWINYKTFFWFTFDI